jgi:hypothetical protein
LKTSKKIKEERFHNLSPFPGGDPKKINNLHMKLKSIIITISLLYSSLAYADSLNINTIETKLNSFKKEINTDNLAIGLRLGDPTGITVKKYLENNRAIELIVGRSLIYPGRGYFSRSFRNWGGINPNHVNVRFIDYQTTFPIALQANYLFHNDINRIGELDTKGLTWYYGFGAQFRLNAYRFTYMYQEASGGPILTRTSGVVTNFDIGVNGIAGLEYRIPNSQFSVFLDITLFMEVLDDPFRLWLQNGIGARYHF